MIRLTPPAPLSPGPRRPGLRPVCGRPPRLESRCHSHGGPGSGPEALGLGNRARQTVTDRGRHGVNEQSSFTAAAAAAAAPAAAAAAT
jgi:hypothetical protein